MSRELLKECFDYLIEVNNKTFGEYENLVDKLSNELSKPDPEPVAYMCPDKCGCLWRDNKDGTMSLFGPKSKSCDVCENLPLVGMMPLYAAQPRQQEPLNNDEISKYFFNPIQNLGTAIAFARAIELAHGITK